MKCYYVHHLTGEELTLLESYDSYGEKWIVYEDEEGDSYQCSLEDFEELVGAEITLGPTY